MTDTTPPPAKRVSLETSESDKGDSCYCCTHPFPSKPDLYAFPCHHMACLWCINKNPDSFKQCGICRGKTYVSMEFVKERMNGRTNPHITPQDMLEEILAGCFSVKVPPPNLIEKMIECIRQGADPLTVYQKNPDSMDRTPLIAAVSISDIKSASYLLELGVYTAYDKVSALWKCVADTNSIPMATLLIENGAVIHYQGPKTARNYLHLACTNPLGDGKLIRFLIEKGVNVNQPNDRGQTPLFYIFHGSAHHIFEKFWELLKAGANVHHVDNEGNTFDALSKQITHPQMSLRDMFSYVSQSK